jgi:hypothetical protein
LQVEKYQSKQCLELLAHWRNKNFMKNIIVIILVILITVILGMTVACSQSQLITTLNAAVTAAEIAIPVIGAAVGLPPTTLTAILTYLKLVSTFTGEAATILAGTGTAVQKSLLISEAAITITKGCNCVPPGTPTEVVTVVEAVVNAVGQFLANFPTVKPLPPGTIVGGAPVKVNAATVKINISAADKATLISLKGRSDKMLIVLAGIRK